MMLSEGRFPDRSIRGRRAGSRWSSRLSLSREAAARQLLRSSLVFSAGEPARQRGKTCFRLSISRHTFIFLARCDAVAGPVRLQHVFSSALTHCLEGIAATEHN
jgi:hypothetical protein